MRFDPKTVLCGLQRAEEEGNIPAIIARARTRRDASFSPGRRWTRRACRRRFSTATAVNAREAPSPSSFDRPLNGTEGASLLVSTQGAGAAACWRRRVLLLAAAGAGAAGGGGCWRWRRRVLSTPEIFGCPCRVAHSDVRSPWEISEICRK